MEVDTVPQNSSPRRSTGGGDTDSKVGFQMEAFMDLMTVPAVHSQAGCSG